MALSGSVDGGAGWAGVYLRIVWSATQNIGANNSTITSNLYLVIPGSSTSINARETGGLTIDGNTSGYDNGNRYRGPGTHHIKSHSVTIGHNSDGTRNFGSSGSFTSGFSSVGTLSVSGAWQLDTIPRNSQVSTNKTSYTLGEAITINTNRLSSSFTHRIRIRLHNSSGTLLKQIDSVGGSTTWTPTSAEITTMQNAIPTTNSLNLYIESYNNQVGQSSSVTRAQALTNANPTFTNFTFANTTSTTNTITGSNQVLVKGKSVLRVTISAANKMVAIKGATAVRYSITYDGTALQRDYSTSDVTADYTAINTPGSRTISVTATDSRGNQTTVSKVVQVYDYTSPVIQPNIRRTNNFEDETTVAVSGSYNLLTISGSNKNSITANSLEYRYRQTGGTWGAWTQRPFTVSGSNFTMTSVILSLDNTKSFEFNIRISDRFGAVTVTQVLGTGAPILYVGEHNGNPVASIGGMPDDSSKVVVTRGNMFNMPVISGDGADIAFWRGLSSGKYVSSNSSVTGLWAGWCVIEIDASGSSYFITLRKLGSSSSGDDIRYVLFNNSATTLPAWRKVAGVL